MPQAVLPLLMNTLIACMFVASFLTIAHLNPAAAKVRWIALSYGFGGLEPISRLATIFGADDAVVKVVAPSAFVIGLALMSPALSKFYGRPPMWAAFFTLSALALTYYWFFGDAPTDNLLFELGYQSFFAASMLLCAITVLRQGPKSLLYGLLVGIFALASLQFIIKPFVARYIGTDGVDSNYAASVYAVFSQTMSGALLVAAGLVILVAVLQTVVETNYSQARLDPLTGLPNRRALHEAFARWAGRPNGSKMSIAVLDLDHFKSINDRYGHGRGDDVLRAVAECLENARPSAAIAARIGGEEFVLLFLDRDGEPSRLFCESIRLSIAALSMGGDLKVTASIGLTTVQREEDLADALRRADRALYQAKSSGRDQCVFIQPADEKPMPIKLSIVR